MVSLRGALLLSVSLLAFLLPPVLAATSLKASVDKNPAMFGEVITLQLQLDDKVDAGALDYSALNDDFRVTGPSVSQSMQIINGQASQSTSWILSLFPKRTGDLTIPALTVAGQKSEPIIVQVQPASQQPKDGVELFLQNSFSREQAYVQQVLYYDVKIYFKGELQSGSLTQPELAGAEINQLGKDKDGTEIVNGERYQTITRRYSVIPQKSGELTLTAPGFTGEMIDRSTNQYDYFARTKRVGAQGEQLTLQVKPSPAQVNPWLPAELVTITEEWSTPVDQLVQGEPVTRTITLTAVDLADHQLPDLTIAATDGIKIYPEQPQSRKVERNGRLIAQKVISMALIADKAGALTLPPVQLSWWNTNTDQPAVAELPAVTLQIAAGTAPAVSPVVVSAPANQSEGPASTGWFAPHWQLNYLSLLLLAGWLVSIGLLLGWRFKSRRTVKTGQPVSSAAESTLRFNPRKLSQACQDNDVAGAKIQLLRWARQVVNPEIQTLSELAAQISDEPLQQQIRLLSFDGYQPAGHSWQGQPLLTAWQQYRHSRQSGADQLAALYPNN